MSKQISIVIPLLNEEESLAELYAWISKVLEERFAFEVILLMMGARINLGLLLRIYKKSTKR